MKKTLTMVLAFALIFALGIGATLAWLTATSTPVTNTFTTSDINIELAESKDLNLKMVPGHTITKDPKVTVTAGSEDCYLFVKVEKSSNFDEFMTYAMADGWEQLTDKDGNAVAGVYYMVFDSKDATNTNAKGTAYPVLEGDKVTVLGTVTKDMMNNIGTGVDKDPAPTLTFTAYASQLYQNNTDKFTPFAAWEKVQPTTTPGTNP